MTINGSVIEIDDDAYVIPHISSVDKSDYESDDMQLDGVDVGYELFITDSGFKEYSHRFDTEEERDKAYTDIIRAINSWYNDRRPIDHETTMVRKF